VASFTSALVPLPVSAVADPASTFTLGPDAQIDVHDGSAGAQQVALDLAQTLRPPTGFALPVVTGAGRPGGIALSLDADDHSLGDEGYTLVVADDGVTIKANAAAGLFYGAQTLRELLGPAIEAQGAQPGPWLVPGGKITDYPRYSYRGAMLDVARHFFPVSTVERYIDELSMYKINMLHLHLSDDQGWRIAIDGWPKLTTVGSSTAVGGGTGGFYTKADYTEIVTYAQAHFITVVPEIDMPGHVGAALSSYASLNCDGVAPPINVTIDVGQSSLCVGKADTNTFVRAVIGELAQLTPGPYIHIGGDEAQSTSASDYGSLIAMAAQTVENDGKTPMGWADIEQAQLPPGTVAQYWSYQNGVGYADDAAKRGGKLVMSPAEHVYLDQKYTLDTTLGLQWAGIHELPDAYDWDPSVLVSGASAAVIGVEGPLWSETLSSLADIEYMAWPRMAEVAEVAWTPQASRAWASFAPRLAAQGPAWKVLGVNFYASPKVAWPAAG